MVNRTFSLGGDGDANSGDATKDQNGDNFESTGGDEVPQSGLSGGGTAGIVIAVVLVGILVAGAIFVSRKPGDKVERAAGFENVSYGASAGDEFKTTQSALGLHGGAIDNNESLYNTPVEMSPPGTPMSSMAIDENGVMDGSSMSKQASFNDAFSRELPRAGSQSSQVSSPDHESVFQLDNTGAFRMASVRKTNPMLAVDHVTDEVGAGMSTSSFGIGSPETKPLSPGAWVSPSTNEERMENFRRASRRGSTTSLC